MKDGMKVNVPCHCRTIPWNLLFSTKTFTPIPNWLAVWSSMAVILKLASPSISMTVLCGAATFAPMAAGRPKPIVCENRQYRGSGND